MDKYLKANAILSKFCRDYMELKKDLPIRPSEMAVINIITSKEEKYTPLTVADLLEVSKPMITSHIAVLEEKGYIKKEYSLQDKRSFYIIPTKKAQELADKTQIKILAGLKDLEEKLGKQNFESLTNLLDNANQIIKEQKNK